MSTDVVDWILIAIPFAILVFCAVYVPWWWFRDRDQRRAEWAAARLAPTFTPADPEDYRDVVEHDWSCTTGTWPHEGFCCPGDTPGRFARVHVLTRLSKAGAANYREDEGCDGQD